MTGIGIWSGSVDRGKKRGPVTQEGNNGGGNQGTPSPFRKEAVLFVHVGCDSRQARKDPRIASP